MILPMQMSESTAGLCLHLVAGRTARAIADPMNVRHPDVSAAVLSRERMARDQACDQGTNRRRSTRVEVLRACGRTVPHECVADELKERLVRRDAARNCGEHGGGWVIMPRMITPPACIAQFRVHVSEVSGPSDGFDEAALDQHRAIRQVAERGRPWWRRILR